MDNRDMLRKHLDAFSAGDFKTYRSHLTDDAMYDEEATHRIVKGPDEIVKLVSGWRKGFPDLKATIKNVVATGDAVVAELEWSGTHSGPFTGPMGTIPPSGKTGKVAAVQVVRFDGNGKIREIRHYFDLMTVLQQIGVAPRPTAPPAP
jgi:steroid delta-isomerase-like uncharacterized protein